MFKDTLNKMGYATQPTDEFSVAFIRDASKQDLPTLEIGAAFGFATKELTKTNSNLYINDLSQEHLEYFSNALDESARKRVKLCPGFFPDECSFSDNFFSHILASRVLHILPPKKLIPAVQNIYDILLPGGKLYFITDTPHLKILNNFKPVYEQRKREGHPFPGFVDDTEKYMEGRGHQVPKEVNFLDFDTVKNVFSKTNFAIEEMDYISQEFFPDDLKLDGRESIGLIARKPH